VSGRIQRQRVKRTVPQRMVHEKYVLQIPVTIDELAELEAFFGSKHGLAGRIRSEILTNVRAAKRRGEDFSAKCIQPGASSLGGWIKQKLAEKYGPDHPLVVGGKTPTAAPVEANPHNGYASALEAEIAANQQRLSTDLPESGDPLSPDHQDLQSP
jgi:hypothetical protein